MSCENLMKLVADLKEAHINLDSSRLTTELEAESKDLESQISEAESTLRELDDLLIRRRAEVKAWKEKNAIESQQQQQEAASSGMLDGI